MSARPVRKAAVAATQRISEMFSRKHKKSIRANTSSMSKEPVQTHPTESYIETYHYIRAELDTITSESTNLQKGLVLRKIFIHLISNPTILIYEPEFRITVSKKLNEFEYSTLHELFKSCTTGLKQVLDGVSCHPEYVSDVRM